MASGEAVLPGRRRNGHGDAPCGGRWCPLVPRPSPFRGESTARLAPLDVVLGPHCQLPATRLHVRLVRGVATVHRACIPLSAVDIVQERRRCLDSSSLECREWGGSGFVFPGQGRQPGRRIYVTLDGGRDDIWFSVSVSPVQGNPSDRSSDIESGCACQRGSKSALCFAHKKDACILQLEASCSRQSCLS